MAAFAWEGPSDRARFDAHWARLRQDPSVIARTVVGEGGAVLGNIGVFGPAEQREVTYWIGRAHWGRGAASAALRAMLGVEITLSVRRWKRPQVNEGGRYPMRTPRGSRVQNAPDGR
jgi:hypothetical protein